MHYQPVVDLHSGRIVGVEALLRGWIGGFPAAPRTLLSTLRQTGVDVPGLVLERASRDLVAWDAIGGGDAWISVNVDTIDLEQADVVASVARAADLIDPGRLVVEITEVGAVASHRLDRVLDDLRHVGVRLAVDDFGVAASTLAQFERVRPHVVKIDRSFVDAIERQGPGRAMVEVTLALARPARVEVVAEGVETVAQLGTLRALGCRFAQGHLFSRAVPADHIERLFCSTPEAAVAG